MSENVNRDTPYGRVNGKVLDELYESFDTMRILEAVDVIDEIRYRICEPDQLRQDLLRLHGMAHTLINGAAMTESPDPEKPIWELAEELDMEMFEWAPKLEKVIATLQELIRLIPEEEWEAENEDE